jgi:serine/threonine-protein kinase
VSDEAARPDGPTLPRCPHCGKDHPPHLLKCPDTDLALPLEGRLLHGKFRFVRQLGKGGMASVWAAVNTLVERRVAIKLIRPEAGRSDETLARFRAEAKAAGRIGHPNVCEILDFGLGPLGPYIVMERLRGRSLGQLVRDEERLEPALAASIVRQALGGLEAAHRRGIIHRDLKPENLFIHQPEVGAPVVKIMDFGVSKFMDGSSEVETAHGALLGTPEYMSPEQFRGASRADARTDVWAMGAILYKVLTGTTAFGGTSVPGTLLMVTTEEPKPIGELVRGVPPELVEVVERCLRKDPDERFQSAQALADALEPFDLDGMASLSVTPESAEPSDEQPSPPTISVGPKVEEEAGSEAEPEPSRAGAETLLPTTRRRMGADEARRPTRPDRRAWLLIAGVTVIGAGVLVALTQGSGRDPQQLVDATVPEAERGDAATTDAGVGASPAEGTSTRADQATHEPTMASEGGGAEPPFDTTGGAEPVASDGSPGTTGDTTGDEPPIGDEPTTGIPEGPDDDDGDDDGGASGHGPGFDPTQPPPTPPGTIRVGNYLTLAKPGPSSTHTEARAYCRALGRQSFVGVKVWTLAGPQTARKLAAHVKRGKYWTTALWKGKAIVLELPSQTKSSLAAEKKGPRPLCVAKWP